MHTGIFTVKTGGEHKTHGFLLLLVMGMNNVTKYKIK